MTFGKYGSATEHQRYVEKNTYRKQRVCSCGCNTTATSKGMANGVCLIEGCDLRVRRWVRDGV